MGLGGCGSGRLGASRCSLLVTEMFGDGRTPQERWDAMSGVVAEMAASHSPHCHQLAAEPAGWRP